MKLYSPWVHVPAVVSLFERDLHATKPAAAHCHWEVIHMPRTQRWHEAHQILKKDLDYLHCDLKLANGLSSFQLIS